MTEEDGSIFVDAENINDKWLIVYRKLKKGVKLEDIPEAQGISDQKGKKK